MVGFAWNNIAWGADVIYYLLYTLGGFFGLSLGGAAVTTVTFYLFSKAFRIDYWEKAFIYPILLLFLYPIHKISFRGQLLSLMMFGVLTLVLTRYEQSRGKTLYFVPLVFVFWANLHGLFITGLAVFLLWEGFTLLSVVAQHGKRSDILSHLRHFIPVTTLSFLAGVVHPFGIGTYQEALKHFHNPLLKTVAEYNAVTELSMQWYTMITVAVLIGIGVTIFTVRRQLFVYLPILGPLLILYGMSLWVRRYSWAMYYLSIPFLQPIATFLRPLSKKNAFLGATTLFGLYLLIVLFLKYPYSQYLRMSWDEYCKDFLTCSPYAAQALRKYYQEGATMTMYNWGGWMIWNYPDMKPSVDGRMHLWRDEKGYSAFEIDYHYEQALKDIDDSEYNVVFTSTAKPIYRRLTRLAGQKKWEKVYQDTTAAIFVRTMK